MQILSISTDRAMLKNGHGAQEKAMWLAGAFSHTHVILFTTDRSLHHTIPLSDRLTIYPTRSRHPLLYVRDAQRISKNIIQKNTIHTVTTQDPFLTGLVGIWIKKKYGVLLQVQIHTDISSRQFWAHRLGNRVRMYVSHRTLPGADRVRVVSERIKQYVESRYPMTDVVTLPVWINTPKIEQSTPIDLHTHYHAQTIVTTACRLEREKNIDQIIDAFVRVSDKDHVLVIIGSGSLETQLQNQAKQSAAHDRIHFVSWSENLPGYLKGSDVYISASDYEGFGLSLIEAAMCGCRIVSTCVGVVGHELTEDVYVASNPRSLNQALASALSCKTSSNLEQQAYNLVIDRANYLAQYRDALVIE